MKPTMGGSRDGCNGTMHGASHIFTWNRKLTTRCKGCATREGNVAIPTNATRHLK